MAILEDDIVYMAKTVRMKTANKAKNIGATVGIDVHAGDDMAVAVEPAVEVDPFSCSDGRPVVGAEVDVGLQFHGAGAVVAFGVF